jgi:hypothetical protein
MPTFFSIFAVKIKIVLHETTLFVTFLAAIYQ